MNLIWKGMNVFVLILMLTGCWDYAPLESKFIVTAIGIDPGEKNPSQIKISAFGSFYEKDNDVISAEGETMHEALRSIQNQTEKVLALSHLRIIIISEEVAKKGITSHLDTFLRDPQMRTDTYVVVSNTQAADLLNSKNHKHPITGESFVALFTKSVTQFKTPIFRVPYIGFATAGDNHSFALPLINLNLEKKLPNYAGLVLLKEGRMVTKLDHIHKIGYFAIKGDLQRAIYTLQDIQIGDLNIDRITFQIYKQKYNIKVVPDGKSIRLQISMRFTGDILEMMPWQLALVDESEMKQLDLLLAKDMKRLMREVMTKVQKLKMDPFQFSELARVKWPQGYNPSTWNEQFAQIPVDFEVQVHIDRSGQLY